MREIEKGMLAWSRAGHDTGKLYVILDIDETYAYLVDGERRTLANPKKKKWKHLQVMKKIPDELDDVHWQNIRDEQVKRAIKILKKEINQEV